MYLRAEVKDEIVSGLPSWCKYKNISLDPAPFYEYYQIAEWALLAYP